MNKLIGSELCFEAVGSLEAWDEARQAIESSGVWADEVDIAKAWYQASQAIGKDAEYCASVQRVLAEALQGDLRTFRERVDESYLCFGTLVRNWRKARNWIYRNESTERQQHSRHMSELNLLARTLRQRGRLQSICLDMFSDAKRDLDYVQAKQSETNFSYLSSGQLASRR